MKNHFKNLFQGFTSGKYIGRGLAGLERADSMDDINSRYRALVSSANTVGLDIGCGLEPRNLFG